MAHRPRTFRHPAVSRGKDGRHGPWASINPYIDWALGPGRRHYFQQEPDNDVTPLLLRLLGDIADGLLEEIERAGRELNVLGPNWLRILCRTRPDRPGRSTVWVRVLANARVRAVIVSPEFRRVILSVSLARQLGFPALRGLARLPDPLPRPQPEPWARAPRRGGRRRMRPNRRARAFRRGGARRTVIMGVIDDGIAFAHERFRRNDGRSRVEYCHLQGPGFDLTKAQIDGYLVAHADEEVLYRAAGLYNFGSGEHKSAAWRVAHGTHVMDLACGYDPADDRDDRPIVCVQLPVAETAEEDPYDLYVLIGDAIDYIVERADSIAADRGEDPLVVINISYGLLADPHDGTGDIEKLIDDKITECWNDLGMELRVVLPSGNSYLSRIHAQFSFDGAPAVQTVEWHVQPDDRTPSFLEIWLPDPCPDREVDSRVTLRVISPTGLAMTTWELGPSVDLVGAAGVYASAFWVEWQPSDRARFVVALLPTSHLDPSLPGPLAPAGRWRIELTYTGGLAVNDVVHAWVRRDDHLYGFPLHGRQSYLDDPQYRQFDHAGRHEVYDNNVSPIRREATINSIATGRWAIVIGGYLRKERLLAKYSAAGTRAPPPPPPPRWPDAMTVSEDSRVHSGVRGAGSHSGSVITMGGTSVAAPQIARLIADDLAAGGDGDWAAVAASVTIPLPQPERSGAGGIEPPPGWPPRYDP